MQVRLQVTLCGTLVINTQRDLVWIAWMEEIFTWKKFGSYNRKKGKSDLDQSVHQLWSGGGGASARGFEGDAKALVLCERKGRRDLQPSITLGRG